MLIQYDLFLTKEETMLQSIDDMQKTLRKTQKALFAKQSEVVKKVYDLESDMALLKHHICKGKPYDLFN